MNKDTEFPFERARRVTPEENLCFREALQDQFGVKLRKRQPLDEKQNESEEISHSKDFLATSSSKLIRLVHPIILFECDRNNST